MPQAETHAQAETHKAEIGANPSPDAVATAENDGDGREWRWQGCIWRAENEDRAKNQAKKKKKTLNRGIRNIF
jgi:hypothetical protein